MSLELRGEAFNIANHVNPGDPNNTGTIPGGVDITLTDANFGKIVSALDPRIMQVAKKFVFYRQASPLAPRISPLGMAVMPG